jgi:hypothetical protein
MGTITLQRVSRTGTIALAIAALAGAWTLLLIVTGGFDVTLIGVTITAHDVMRPAWAGAVALAVYVWARGPRQVWDGIAAIGRAIDRRLARVRVPDRIAASAIAAAVAIFGVGWNAGVGGGADTYGYLSQAELWRHGLPIVPQPFAADVPWPDADWTFTPLGYTVKRGGGAIVPTYSAGLPLVMAAAKSVAGQAAMFWIAPLAGAVLVLVAYDAGRRLASSRAGLTAAFLVATSQALLGDLTVPTSDVLAAAGLSVACVLLFRDSRIAVFAAGVAVALALPVRPNLAPTAAVLGLWLVTAGRPSTRSHWRARLIDGAAFGLAALPGLLVPMWSNARLYGSPFESGYGDIGAFYQWRHFPINLYQYTARMFEAQAWLAPVGIVAALAPIQKLWPDSRTRSIRTMAALFAASLLVQYLFYEPARDSGFLRYLLPAWPFFMVGLAQVLLLPARPRRSLGGRGRGGLIALLVVAYGANAMYDMSRKGSLPPLSERKYFGAAELARVRTEPNSILFAMQHSGSARYYAGRMTLRYDILNPAWLDRSVAWLSEHGVHAYALLDDWEAKDFQKRFAGQATVAQLDRPVAIYQGAVVTHFYDLAPAGTRGPAEVVVDRFDGPHFPPPSPPPVFGFRR